MIDLKIITEYAQKMLDILYSQGYVYGKVEVDFDRRTGRLKMQIHQFERAGEESIRRTTTVTR